MSQPSRKILLISPPWQMPSASSLALATLRPILEREGMEVDEIHGSLLFPFTFSDSQFLEQMSAYLFAPLLYPSIDQEEMIDYMIQTYQDDQTLGGILSQHTSALEERAKNQLRIQARADMRRASLCIDRIVEQAQEADYDVVGFSCTFEDQLPAALTIARRLKEANPAVRIMLGGAACFEVQGDGIAASFPQIDAVCHTEGETVVGPLVRALRGEISMEDVPGIAWRDADGALRHNPSPKNLVDMNTIPMADFDPFIAQFEGSEWSKMAKPKLFFETSRGCWWGEKHLCTFCGLNAEGLSFRCKSPERAFDEIAMFHDRYPQVGYLQATDNILDMGYFKHVMPRLAELNRLNPDRPLEMFYEIKSNLRRDQIEVLADSGVVDVQPGIESFSDGVLKLMNKGATGLGQVQFIKWAYEAGINLIYNIIIRNPGEEVAWYEEMLDLIPYIEHLPPPIHVTNMMLERFSPYHSKPERYGITNVRPKPYYARLYPDPNVDLSRIAYIFDYDHPVLEDEALKDVHRRLVARIAAWQSSWELGNRKAFYVERGDAILVFDERTGTRQQGAIAGSAAEVYRYLDKARPEKAIYRTFGHLDPELLAGLIDTWLHRRWICRLGHRYIAVLPSLQRRTKATARGTSDVVAQATT